MQKPHLSFGQGFTLIELLIVVSIMGILAAVILVNTTFNANRAKEQTGRSTMRSVLTHMVLCISGNSTNTDYVVNANICNNTLMTNAKWPVLGSSCTSFTSVAGTNVFVGVCGGKTITCNAVLGSCI